MKIYHYQRRDGVENFGDALNQWLWPRLLPGQFEGDDGTTFVGIGTLLNHRLPERLPQGESAVIFSTGAGYEKPLPALPDHWRVCCVRGPLSAKRLGLPPETAITDGAILLRLLFQPEPSKQATFGFMPHVHHAVFAGEVWQHICEDLGFLYIDPRWPVETVLTAIAGTEVLLAEAMHGAIAADALRVPWIPIHTSARILAFKWQDWCASVNLPYRPCYVLPLVPPYPPVARGVRSGLQAAQYWVACATQQPSSVLPLPNPDNRVKAAQQLASIAQRESPYCSEAGLFYHRLEQLYQALMAFKEA